MWVTYCGRTLWQLKTEAEISKWFNQENATSLNLALNCKAIEIITTIQDEKPENNERAVSALEIRYFSYYLKHGYQIYNIRIFWLYSKVWSRHWKAGETCLPSNVKDMDGTIETTTFKPPQRINRTVIYALKFKGAKKASGQHENFHQKRTVTESKDESIWGSTEPFTKIFLKKKQQMTSVQNVFYAEKKDTVESVQNVVS